MDNDNPRRALIEYRTKELKGGAKWSLWFQRIVTAKDSQDAMDQFYKERTWPAMTGDIQVKGVTWPDEV